jgi:hypothetical protein
MDRPFNFDIYFDLDGKDIGFKTLPAVPRIGDCIMFHNPKRVTYLVRGVTWGVAPDDVKACTVNVHLTIKPDDL